MIYSWPPSGRMSAGYSQSARRSTSSRSRQIAGKVGYAVVPGNPEHATGFNKALSADSANPEAAYLFMQWVTSPPVSLARVMLPYALRDPYRLSHFKSDLYGQLWPEREGLPGQPQQLGQRRPARPDHARRPGLLPEPRPDVRRRSGPAPIRRRRWRPRRRSGTTTTDRLGVDSQKAFYAEFLKLPGATADNTVEKLGMAVKLD